MDSSIILSQEQQFDEVINIILQHQGRASRAVNEEILLMAWNVGSYVSHKLKSEEWGSKVVTLLSEYIRTKQPKLKGYSRSSIYNMVLFYEEYSSERFLSTASQYLSKEFVQPKTVQINNPSLSLTNQGTTVFPMQIVQPRIGQFPKLLTLTTLTNHIEILCRCKSSEERLFYILYAHKEHLVKRELQRSITNQTYATLLGDKKNMSKGLLQTYPNAPVVFKDTLFVDFLGLPQKHSETKLKKGLIEHMKQLFFHRGLQALVAVELKKTKFHPRDLGQLEFYLEALDRDVKRSNENPSIGILLCPDADKMVVEYAMSRSMSPTLITEYKRILIPQERMQEQLNEYCNLFLEEQNGTND